VLSIQLTRQTPKLHEITAEIIKQLLLFQQLYT